MILTSFTVNLFLYNILMISRKKLLEPGCPSFLGSGTDLAGVSFLKSILCNKSNYRSPFSSTLSSMLIMNHVGYYRVLPCLKGCSCPLCILWSVPSSLIGLFLNSIGLLQKNLCDDQSMITASRAPHSFSLHKLH